MNADHCSPSFFRFGDQFLDQAAPPRVQYVPCHAGSGQPGDAQVLVRDPVVRPNELDRCLVVQVVALPLDLQVQPGDGPPGLVSPSAAALLSAQ